MVFKKAHDPAFWTLARTGRSAADANHRVRGRDVCPLFPLPPGRRGEGRALRCRRISRSASGTTRRTAGGCGAVPCPSSPLHRRFRPRLCGPWTLLGGISLSMESRCPGPRGAPPSPVIPPPLLFPPPRPPGVVAGYVQELARWEAEVGQRDEELRRRQPEAAGHGPPRSQSTMEGGMTTGKGSPVDRRGGCWERVGGCRVCRCKAARAPSSSSSSLPPIRGAAGAAAPGPTEKEKQALRPWRPRNPLDGNQR